MGRISDELTVMGAVLSFHLKELYRVGLVSSRQESRFIYYTANFERLAAIMTFLASIEASVGWMAMRRTHLENRISIRFLYSKNMNRIIIYDAYVGVGMSRNSVTLAGTAFVYGHGNVITYPVIGTHV